MKNLDTWKLIAESLTQHVAVMLLYVLESSGSSPGRQGFCMAVNEAGEMEGSLGGGIMEHKFVELAKARLRSPGCERSLHKQVHKKNAARDRSGMICSGEQTILLFTLDAPALGDVKRIVQCLELAGNGLLRLCTNGMKFQYPVTEYVQTRFHFTSEKDWLFEDTIGPKNHAIIVGGGHCALALSRTLNHLGFFIHLFDDRPSLKTMQENIYAHKIKVLKSYELLSNEVFPGLNHYVVIMTVGYRTDMMALKALIDKDVKYIGVLGSKAKISEMFADAGGHGMDKDKLAKVHAPIGLPINSQTPEEVAISIAAEIIKVQNAM